jgi:hypothetical protein
MAVKRKFKSDLITVVNGDFVEQLWVKVIVGGQSLYVCTDAVMLSYMKCICIMWSLCLKIVMSTIIF